MSFGLMMVILIGLMLAFILGWLRGRRDLAEDMQPALDKLEGVLLLAQAKPSAGQPCAKCGHREVKES